MNSSNRHRSSLFPQDPIWFSFLRIIFRFTFSSCISAHARITYSGYTTEPKGQHLRVCHIQVILIFSADWRAGRFGWPPVIVPEVLLDLRSTQNKFWKLYQLHTNIKHHALMFSPGLHRRAITLVIKNANSSQRLHSERLCIGDVVVLVL